MQQQETAPRGVGILKVVDHVEEDLACLVRGEAGQALVFFHAGRADAGGGVFVADDGAVSQRQLAAPGVVGVTGQHHQLLAHRVGGLQQGFALGRITIPGIHVVTEAGVLDGTEQRLLGRRQGGRVLSGDGLRLEEFLDGLQGALLGGDGIGIVLAEAGQDAGGKGHPRHQDLLSEHLPGSLRLGQLLQQPVALPGAQHAAYRVVQGGHGRHGRHRFLHAGQVDLALAPRHPGFEHVQGQQATEVEAAIALAQIARVRHANRHPFVPGLQGGVAPGHEGARCGIVVVRGTGFPEIVGDLVVVPDGDHRHGGRHQLAVRVRAVLGIARPVVVQGRAFPAGLHHAAQGFGIGTGVAARSVLVDEIAEVQCVLGVTAGGFTVGMEMAGRIVRAAQDSQAHIGDTCRRQGAGPARWRTLPGVIVIDVVPEAVAIALAGLQPAGVDMDRMVVVRAGDGDAAGDDAPETGIFGHFPAQRHLIVTAGVTGMGPENHPVGKRVAAGDAVVEAGVGDAQLLVVLPGVGDGAAAQGLSARVQGGDGGQADDEVATWGRRRGFARHDEPPENGSRPCCCECERL